jgi:translocator assembly and maintenance protein 41
MLAKLVRENFPPLSFCFAYGSMVKNQSNGSNSKMMDFVFVVEDSVKWHSMNLKRNPSHYSTIARWCGSECITRIQRNYGGGVYYNTMVNVDTQLIKYGVIEKMDLKQDLLEWKSCYISGRMQKPIEIVLTDPEVLEWNRINLKRAFLYGLNQCPNTFTEYELFHSIASISYLGDIRMGRGEDPNKISNIVMGNKVEFGLLYKEWMEMYLIRVQDRYEKNGTIPLDEYAQQDIPNLIRSTSISQSIKGIFSAGSKSWTYLLQKRAAALKK